jgi:protein-S-isoprenylcysteine O-methyltransferase Ste14
MFFYGVVAVAIAIWAAAKAPEASTPGGVITFGIGLCFMCGGLVLRWRSFKALSRYLTVPVTTSPDQLLITTGPYRFVRHPSYLGLILVLAGIGVILANWLSIAVLALVPLIGVMYRTHIEEDALPGILGDAYTGYASTRKRLVPFVW